MKSNEDDEKDMSIQPRMTKITTTVSIGETDSSLSLSLTPPSLDEVKKTGNNEQPEENEASEESISEHLSSAATSIENDRSLQEIEIDNIPAYEFNEHEYDEDENLRISQETKPASLNTSFQSDKNAESLTALGLLNIEHGEIRSILEEILNNEQFVSDSESLSKKSREDSFDIFADLDLEDKSLTERIISQMNPEHDENLFNRSDTNLDNFAKQVKDLEELIEVKDQTIEALTSELDSLRGIVSDPSTLSMGTLTEYKQLHEDYHNKFVEYHNAIEQKDDLILQLTESLQQSISNREELKVQVDHFKNELEYLQKQLENTSQILLKNEPRSKTPELDVMKKIEKDGTSILLDLEDTDFENECMKLQETLNLDQEKMLNRLRNCINRYIEDKLNEHKREHEETLTNLKNTIQEERDTHDKEALRLRDLIANMKCGSTEIMELRLEMEVKHQKEMEDLRRYFEQKCTELEKNYSDEIFSHHSRKRSGSTSSSDNELPPDISGLPARPGPGGDAPSSLETYRVDYKNRALQNLSKTDLVNLKRDVTNILGVFEKFDLDESTEEKLVQLKDELGNYDVKNLFRIEMEAFRCEIKNKYNAELEILNQDYENKVDLLKLQQEEKLNSMKEKYLEEIENLKEILNKTNKAIGYSSAVQEVCSSGDFEINEVVQSYERRLQEQVTMAKIDIIGALESQIQRLAANESSDEEWPQELLTLRDRFTERYERKISELNEEHQKEVAKLKEEHIRNLNGALGRARRRSLRDGDSFIQLDVRLVEERDNFKKQAGLLRNLLGELLKYFTQCEDEVNNTIVDELVRQAAEKNLTDIEKELNDSTSSNKTESSSSTLSSAIKRVHLTPNVKDLMSMLENLSERDTDSLEFSTDLKNELEACLEKLRSEANAVLTLSMNVSRRSEVESEKSKQTEGTLGSLNRKLIEEVQMRMKMSEEMEEQREIIDSLEKERSILEGQVVELIDRLNITQADLGKAQMKISELLESGQREIVSEGYGGNAFVGDDEQGQAVTAFNRLQEKARTMLVGSHSHEPSLLHLLEELIIVGERIVEESKTEKRDLQQQVEHLESQLRESTKLLEVRDQKLREIESEKDEAVEKIFFLRDVIRELEAQVKTKTETEVELRILITELESLISQQNRGIAVSLETSDGRIDGSEVDTLRGRVRSLEAEVQNLRLSQELVGTEGALRELRDQLLDIENNIDKRTKELEEQSSIVSTTTCSSPSEDMSVRDVIRPKTPTSMAINDCEIPLQQLARLKEKLVRHARAEDAALKRIRDLEMQVYNLKASNEEYQTEKDILKKEISDQLVLISSLQIRLDDQRIRAEHIEKQTNSSLESRIYDLQKEISDLQENLVNRNKTITHLNGLIEEMRVKIEERESEVDSVSDDEMIITMQKEIEHLRNQNELLHKRLNSGVDIIPNLVENIISDKNSDIESLKQKLESAEKQLEMFSSLNLDKTQISTLKSLKDSGTSLSEVLSIIDFSNPEQARRMGESTQDTLLEHRPLLRRKSLKKDDTVFLSNDDVQEISSIEKVGVSNERFISITPVGKKNSTEILRSADRHVRFDFSGNGKHQTDMENLISELERLKSELSQKDELIKDCNDRLKTLTQLETNIDFVQAKLEETQNSLKEVTDKFEKELSDREESEKELRIELVHKKMYLEEQEKELTLLRDDAVRKDEMYLNLAKETKNLKKEKEILEEKLKEYQDIENVMSVKNKIILELEEQIGEFRNKDFKDDMQLEERLKSNEEECESLKLRLETLSKEHEEKDRNIRKLEADNRKLTEIVKIETENGKKLRKNMQNKEKQIEEYERQVNRIHRDVEILKNEKFELVEEIKAQTEVIAEKKGEIKRYNEEIRKLETGTIKELEKRISDLQQENSLKLTEVDQLTGKLNNLDGEMRHFQELLVEKDKIIAQFRRDSEHLQMNLETIQNKMQESGNVIDLGRKLRDEQMRNSELMEEIQLLKAQMMGYKFSDKDPMVASIDEITGKVKRELDYSAQIDMNLMNATEDSESAEELRDTLSKLKLKYNELNKKYLETQNNDRLLRSELEKKKIEFDEVQLEDANLIEKLRIELESAGENEIELERIADSWKRQCEVLEIEVSKLRGQLSNTNSKSESTEYKKLPSRESQEMQKLKDEVASLTEGINSCRNEVKNLKKTKKELEVNLKYSKDMLELKNREIANLEKVVEQNTRKEGVLMEKFTTCNEQLQKKEKEVENSRSLIDEMEQERKEMKKQIDQLNENLRILQEEKKKPNFAPYSPNTSLPIADQLMNKIEEINSSVKNDRRTMDLILRLTKDNKMLKNRILELETEGTTYVPFENPMNRANYLFAKCLRVESYRKALIWQKHYLISLLGSYQHTTDLGPMEKLRGGQRRIKFSGIQKFRCAAYAIIATLRMKFIVRRWHSGARLAENVNSRYKNTPASFRRFDVSEQAQKPGNFQVGQPVSRQQFTQSTRRSSFMNADNFHETVENVGNIPGNSDSRLSADHRNGGREEDMPWSGASPPSKDKSSGKPRLSSNLSLLKAPQLLNQYAERYNKIQENLELLLNSDPPT